MFCPNCGTENPDTAKFCQKCGADLLAAIPAGAEALPPTGPKRRKNRLGLFLAMGGVIVVLLAAVVAGVFLLPQFLPQGEQVLLAFPSRSGEADLYLLKLGQEEDEGVRIAEDAIEASPAWFYFFEKEQVWSRIGGEYGGFIPNSKRVLFWYQDDDDEVVVREIAIGDEEASEIMDSKALPLYGAVFDDSGTLFLRETRDGQYRCYAARPGQEAERLAKGDWCWFSLNGSTVYLTELDDDETTLSTVGMDGENETVVLDEVEDVESTRVSNDASHVAYLQQTDEGQQLYLVERSSGTKVEASAELFGILEYGFLPGSDTLFYIAENDEGMLGLYTSDNATAIAEGVTLGATAGPEGKHLVYMVGDKDGEKTVYVHPMTGGEDVKLLTGNNLQYDVIPSPPRILILETEEDEITLHSADTSGSNLVELYKEDGITLAGVHYVADESTLYLLVSEEDGTTLFATPADKADGFRLLDEWYQVTLLNRPKGGRQLVFWGQEDRGDDSILYSVAVKDGAHPIELDDDNKGFRNAVFTANGKAVLYTAETGSDPDDVDVCQVPADGSDKYEVLYREAFLADVRWDDLHPFDSIRWQSVRSGTSFCPGAPAVQVGATVEGKVEAGEVEAGEERCYRFSAREGDVITFDVDTPEAQRYDFELTFYDREGLQLSYNDDGPSGDDPRLTVSIDQTGLYFLMLGGYGSAEEATYSLTVREGVGDPGFADAQLLQPDSRTRDTITSNSALHVETFDWEAYGNTYYFNGQADDTVTIDVYAESIGSELDPLVFLFDVTLGLLTYDEDSGAGSDSQLTYTLSATGRYYILVMDEGGDYGSADTYFYEILLSID